MLDLLSTNLVVLYNTAIINIYGNYTHRHIMLQNIQKILWQVTSNIILKVSEY